MPVLPFQGVKHMGATSYQGVALRCRVLAPLARNNHKSCKITDDTGFHRTTTDSHRQCARNCNNSGLSPVQVETAALGGCSVHLLVRPRLVAGAILHDDD